MCPGMAVDPAPPRNCGGLISSGKDTGEHIPSAAASVYARERERGRELADRALFETAMLSRLRMLSQEDFLALPTPETVRERGSQGRPGGGEP